jgi:hypothetical protein
VHSNLRLIYRQREEWVKGKTKMWDVRPDDMGLDNSVELALANLDLNEPVLEPVTLDDGDPLEGSSSISADAQIASLVKLDMSWTTMDASLVNLTILYHVNLNKRRRLTLGTPNS